MSHRDLPHPRVTSLPPGRRLLLCFAGLLVAAAGLLDVGAGAALADSPSFTWSPPVNVDGISPVAAISCPTSSLCVATDDQGNVITSTDPMGGQEAWAFPVWVDQEPEVRSLHAVSCTSSPSLLCAGADFEGHAVTSTDPTGGRAAWNVVPLTGNQVIPWAISCASASFCVTTGDDEHGGDLFTSTAPTGSGSAWKPTSPLFEAQHPGALYGVSCPSSALCVAVGEVGLGGGLFSTSNPTGGASAWTGVNLEQDALLGVSCLTSGTLCVAYDGTGDVFTSTDPTGGKMAWTKTDIDGSDELAGISCTSNPSLLCVAVDRQGNAVTSTDPTGGAGAWTVSPVDDAQLTSVSCATSALCVIGDAEGDVLAPATAAAAGESTPALGMTTAPATGSMAPVTFKSGKCRKGFAAKKVKGKEVCLRVKKHRRHKRHPKRPHAH